VVVHADVDALALGEHIAAGVHSNQQVVVVSPATYSHSDKTVSLRCQGRRYSKQGLGCAPVALLMLLQHSFSSPTHETAAGTVSAALQSATSRRLQLLTR
jgi:hypothetical protein